jgi:hypothetical protein
MLNCEARSRYNKTSGSWTARSCIGNTSKYGPHCARCADVTSCTESGGHIPCIYANCNPPPRWSVVRSEEFGYVRITATTPTAISVRTHGSRAAATVRVEFLAVDTNIPGSVGVVRDSFAISR